MMRSVSRPISRALRELRGLLLTFGMPKPSIGTGRFIRRDRRVRVSFDIAPDATIEMIGNLIFQSDLGEIGHTRISLGKGSKLRVLGDFTIGPEVNIMVGAGAELVVGGRKESSGSGITCSTRIMVRQRVEIGEDSIIAWDVFITDCDWHMIEGRPHTMPTIIGSKVWLAHGTSVLKGSTIGAGSILAAHAVCSMRDYPRNSLLGGAPARVLRQDVVWHRDLQ
jgi:acetyltransferase-like isoleucine patch superfamily enzyme